ncbi:MAG: hypothetical protein JW953_02990 [Anaerolineae bacterium]|nr:hypothetical protein [Anaerolineae bacterium]
MANLFVKSNLLLPEYSGQDYFLLGLSQKCLAMLARKAIKLGWFCPHRAASSAAAIKQHTLFSQENIFGSESVGQILVQVWSFRACLLLRLTTYFYYLLNASVSAAFFVFFSYPQRRAF